jgi:hypothetical protein
MDLWYLKPGHKVKMRDGAEAEVLAETEDGEWIRVRYLDGGDLPQLVLIGEDAAQDALPWERRASGRRCCCVSTQLKVP